MFELVIHSAALLSVRVLAKEAAAAGRRREEWLAFMGG